MIFSPLQFQIGSSLGESFRVVQGDIDARPFAESPQNIGSQFVQDKVSVEEEEEEGWKENSGEYIYEEYRFLWILISESMRMSDRLTDGGIVDAKPLITWDSETGDVEWRCPE